MEGTTSKHNGLVEAVERKKRDVNREVGSLSALLKRTLIVVPATMAGYVILERIMDHYAGKRWSRRYIINLPL